jgi:hypothetical protein
MRLLDEAWDFWITNSSFTVWGDKANAMIELAGRNGEAVVTDGHWQANQFGELGKSSPILRANGYVQQQRFVDNKFHVTGPEMPYMVDWSGYRSAFVNCSFQADTASVAAGLVRIRNADNQIIGGHFIDINHGDAIHVLESGDLILSGVSFRSAETPGPGSAVVTEATARGRVTAIGNDIVNFSIGYNFHDGNATITIGPTSFTRTASDIVVNETSSSWNEYNAGKMTATFGGSNVPGPRSMTAVNPTLRVGGNVARNSSGYQGLYLFPQFAEEGRINELLGMGTGWLAGIGAVAGRNIEHPLAWCYDSDKTGECFSIYKKSPGSPVSDDSKVFSITTSGDLRFQASRGQHIQNHSPQSDTAGRLTLSAEGAYTLKFATPWSEPPVCVVSDTSADPGILRPTATNSDLTVSGPPRHIVNYICIGNPK